MCANTEEFCAGLKDLRKDFSLSIIGAGSAGSRLGVIWPTKTAARMQPTSTAFPPPTRTVITQVESRKKRVELKERPAGKFNSRPPLQCRCGKRTCAFLLTRAAGRGRALVS